MDLSNLKTAHGAPSWDTKYNGLVDTVQNVGTTIDNARWTNQSTDGLVMGSGVELKGGGYKYTDAGGVRFVMLSVWVKITTDAKGISLPDVITLPDNIACKSAVKGWLGNSAECTVAANKVSIGDTVGNASRSWNGSEFVITAYYSA